MSTTDLAQTPPDVVTPTVGRKHRGLLEEVWHNFKKNSLSLAGGVIVITSILIAIFAPLLAPYNPVEQFDALPGEHHPLAPMSKSEEGSWFLLGSDKFGRDILSRALYGTRTLLQLAALSIAFALMLGILMGSVAGYNRGTWVDELVMRIVDIMLSFPTLVLAIALLGAFGIGQTQIGPIKVSNMLKIAIVIAVTYSPRFARVMRGVVLQEMSEDYVDAAKMAGGSGWQILTREILVNTIPPLIVQASLMTATTVLTSASLSFLGLGLQPPRPSLGIMLNEARDFLFLGAWWYPLVPGVFILLIILGFNLLGDGLRDSLDPRQARRTRI
ncbi:MAG: ABC transporter permease [Anaerolineae bacterium]|jgi:ABC-type dipeptide/oligopeptide/nickel transport system permease subunit